ncbi:protein KRTCAP2 homolog [Episyrphus balteatus]|uniref:protein KRTCAP2 homolog n=1 Tax=Episyrphus balteatus TaxID=286459 RepID=UPI002484D9BE|nr:protein KRTCAP2 homolog [Episyrphus balteatus]
MAQQNSFVSFVVSSILVVVLLATLRFYNPWFNASPQNTIVGGFIGSWLFIFTLTSVSNIEMIAFGSNFQAKFIPEIAFCLITSVIACGVVHRVCATTCILFSIVGLFFLNKISQKYHNAGSATVEQVSFRKTGGRKNK